MKVVKPIAITDAVLIFSTASETYAEYSATTAYALGERVMLASARKIYECVQAPSLGYSPDANPLYWMEVEPTNKWAMFDDEISTQTEAEDVLTVTLAPGYINSLALLGLEGTTLQIEMTNGADGPIVYSKTINLDGTIITNWYEYFFEPPVQLGDLVLTDLPTYMNSRLTITIMGTGTVKCAQCSVGTFYMLGDTEFGATAGIIDYSRKETSAAGVTRLLKRNFSKRMSVRLQLDTVQINKVQRILADLRATPCAWMGADETARYAPLVVWGFYRDFSIDVAYPTISYCTLEVEGLA